ncbi:NAD(P)-binding protein [Pholiota conissans]|uniref:NAD(P)-binding protein n=1 Tax=Pholiota conissans TaxID=109636 RepID=A0A9P5YSM1_9AGAR|nr:NAD(P)-binding protein [Pholiota conissans]
MWTPKFNPSTDLQDLSGKVVVVSGANQGIGYATVKHLARKGAKVYLGSRNEEKGRNAVAKLLEEGIGSGDVVYFACDLSTPLAAKNSAEGFLKVEERLDALVNNAACIFDYENQASEDGITQMMLVNHFGTFQFTKSLLPLLIKTAEDPTNDVRVVTVGSEQHRNALLGPNAKTAFKNLDECKNMYSNDRMATLSRYALSKLANLLFSNTLHRKLSPHNIICICPHPGVVATTTFTSHLPFSRVIQFVFALLFRGPDEGAYNSCWAAAAPEVRLEVEKYGGAYVAPVGSVVEQAPNAMDVQMQDDLWEMTERYLEGLGL